MLRWMQLRLETMSNLQFIGAVLFMLGLALLLAEPIMRVMIKMEGQYE